MAEELTFEIDIGRVRVVSTDRSDGDFAVKDPAADLDVRRSNIVAYPWTWFYQIHSADVLEVSRPGQHSARQADGAVTRELRCPLSVTTADCGPVVLIAENAIAVVHAGWRGAQAGIIQQAAEILLSNGAAPVAAVVGPMISAAHYEFSKADLTPLVDMFGESVASKTIKGTAALDMAKVVAVACEQAGFDAIEPMACTSDAAYFSYRTRSEPQRLATVAWIDD